MQKPSLILMMISLQGCVDLPLSSTEDAESRVDHLLLQAAQQATQAQQQWAASEQARRPRQVSQPVDSTTLVPALQQPISLNWHGPLEPVVRQIADKIGYRLIILGQAPTLVPMVQIKSHQQPAFMILRELGHQARSQADIHLDPTAQLIELRYGSRHD